MSQISCRMDGVKRMLIEQDMERAAYALTEYIHNNIAPKASLDGRNIAPLELFGCRADVEEFCRVKDLTSHAFEWLLNELRGDHLLEQTDIPVILSRAGVERYCK